MSRSDRPRHVLLTRPEGMSGETIAKINSMGLEVSRAPLLAVEDIETSPPAQSFDGIVLTSANACNDRLADFLKDHPNLLAGPVFVTGAATERAARKIGLSDIRSVSGGALDLVSTIAALPEKPGRLLYPCAEETAHDVAALLGDHGVTCEPWPVYHTAPASSLPNPIRKGLEEGKIDAVLLYSPKTARVFNEVAPVLPEGTKLYCLSRAVAEASGPRLARRCLFPSRPIEDSLLDLLLEPNQGQML